MVIDEQIVAAVTPVVAECVPDHYTGDALEYCTYNFDELPVAHGDNQPHAIRYLVQLHWYLPLGRRPLTTKRALRRAILAAGFTYPSVENASDELGQHFVFEFEAVDGEV